MRDDTPLHLDMDVREHERQHTITLRYNATIQLKYCKSWRQTPINKSITYIQIKKVKEQHWYILFACLFDCLIVFFPFFFFVVGIDVYDHDHVFVIDVYDHDHVFVIIECKASKCEIEIIHWWESTPSCNFIPYQKQSKNDNVQEKNPLS